MPKLTKRDPRMRPSIRGAGFTLIEVMIVVAVVAVLAAIAIPNYSDYVKRSKIVEATSALSDLRVRYEQLFLDTRSYVGGCALFGPTVQATTKAFTIDCSAETISTYAPTATGNPAYGMSTGFVYRINQLNQKSSNGPAGWSAAPTCWATRKNGSCG
jgi:type IV pilus assembly protein PilE